MIKVLQICDKGGTVIIDYFEKGTVGRKVSLFLKGAFSLVLLNSY